MHAAQCIDLLRPWKVQCAGYGHIAEVHCILIAPHREPFDITQCLPIGQRQCDVLVAIATRQGRSSATFIPQPCSTLVARPGRVAHIEVGGGCDAIIIEFFDENRTRINGINIAGDAVMQAS